MKMPHALTLIILFWMATATLAEQPQAAPATAQQQQFFTDQVRPILEERCWDCHGEDVQESGLRLDSRANLMAGGSSGKALANLANPEESYLLEVLQRTGSVAMPPDEALPGQELAVLQQLDPPGPTVVRC